MNIDGWLEKRKAARYAQYPFTSEYAQEKLRAELNIIVPPLGILDNIPMQRFGLVCMAFNKKGITFRQKPEWFNPSNLLKCRMHIAALRALERKPKKCRDYFNKDFLQLVLEDIPPETRFLKYMMRFLAKYLNLKHVRTRIAIIAALKTIYAAYINDRNFGELIKNVKFIEHNARENEVNRANSVDAQVLINRPASMSSISSAGSLSTVGPPNDMYYLQILEAENIPRPTNSPTPSYRFTAPRGTTIIPPQE